MVMPRLIRRDPSIDLSLFGNTEKASSFFPFNEKNMLLFGFGRVALFEGLKILGIKEEDNVMVPEYVCNVVTAPMHRLNIKVKFYEVDKNLVPVWSSIEKKIDKRTKALLIVNYFGFPNDLRAARDFCDRHGIYLIEDNAHSFLSSDNGLPLGSIGDISFFSFRKIAPISNGAALVVNNREFARNLTDPGYLCNKNRDLRFIAKNIYLSVFGSFGMKEIDFEVSRIKDACEEYNLDKYFTKFSKYSYFLLRHFNFNHISEERRNVYSQWLEFFSGFKSDSMKITFPFLKSGVVPSCFPVLVDNRKQFISSMWCKGIECFPWPFLPKESQENYLSRRLVCLPVSPYFNVRRMVKEEELLLWKA